VAASCGLGVSGTAAIDGGATSSVKGHSGLVTVTLAVISRHDTMPTSAFASATLRT